MQPRESHQETQQITSAMLYTVNVLHFVQEQKICNM